MGLVATGAGNVFGVKRTLRARLLVAPRALHRDLRDTPRMRLVTSDAVLGALCGMGRSHVPMATLAGLISRCKNVVGRMTARAIAVLRRGVLRKHAHARVAGVAPQRALRRKRMSLVAVCA